MRPRRLPGVLAVLGASLIMAAALKPAEPLAQTGGTSEENDRIDPRNTGEPRYPNDEPPEPALGVSALTNLACMPLYGTFGAGNWPSGCWRPYSSTSPFNQQIPANPRLEPRSAEIVARVLGFGSIQNLLAGQADTPADFGHPTYYSALTDPLYRLHCYEASWGTCPIEGQLVNVPSAARPAAGGDGHMTIVNQMTGVEYDLYKVRSKPSGGGTLEFRWGGSTSITGSGLGSAATASKFGNLAGIIRAQELEAGTIDHAIFMVVKCDSGQYVYPAQKAGRKCSDIGLSNVDAPPMGARFQLNMSDAEIDALAVPAWKKTIFRAMARYGMIMGDTGSGSFAVQAESGSTYTSFGYEDKLVSFAKRVGVPVSNGTYVFNLRDGVDWAARLRVVYPTLESEVSPPPILELPPLPTVEVPPLPTVVPPPAGSPSSPAEPFDPPQSPSPASPAPAPAPNAPSVAIGSVRLSGRGDVVVTLSCRRATCKGRLALTSVARRPVTLARKAFSVAAGRSLKLNLRLSARGRALLRRVKRLRVKATAVIGANKATRVATLKAGRSRGR